MMLYRIRHTTLYRYSEMVTLCHNEAHLLPRNLIAATLYRRLAAYFTTTHRTP